MVVDCDGDGGRCGVSSLSLADVMSIFGIEPVDARGSACVGVADPLSASAADVWEIVRLMVESLSTLVLLRLVFGVDDRGLSLFALPGILDRIEPRKEREDSRVSDLLNEG